MCYSDNYKTGILLLNINLSQKSCFQYILCTCLISINYTIVVNLWSLKSWDFMVCLKRHWHIHGWVNQIIYFIYLMTVHIFFWLGVSKYEYCIQDKKFKYVGDIVERAFRNECLCVNVFFRWVCCYQKILEASSGGVLLLGNVSDDLAISPTVAVWCGCVVSFGSESSHLSWPGAVTVGGEMCSVFAFDPHEVPHNLYDMLFLVFIFCYFLGAFSWWVCGLVLHWSICCTKSGYLQGRH